ncbi:lipid transferase CIDEB isoform X2 [Emydura macquarii macquarii]|uniref:lipid transferase CIDEB isoform X2 n=1 Tax=Emydura macquarii macquarii TaxID=1129001 RepID=UPI00352B1809
MDYVSALAPTALLQSVASAGSELTRRVLAPSAPPQRPFRVCDHRRGGRTGLMAGTLQELLAKGGAGAYGRSRERPRKGQDIARFTFDVYKLGPRDLFGSLSVKATFYGLYSLSCDFTCLGPKKVLREVLKVASALMQGMGQVLLRASTYIRRLLEGAESWNQRARLSPYED